MTLPSFTARLTLLLASSLTVMATVTIAPALPEISAHFSAHDSAGFWARLLLSAPALSIAIAAVPAGLLVDRVGRIRPLIIACAVYGVAGSAGLWLDGLIALLVSRIVLGASVAVLMMGATALIGDWFIGPPRDRFLGLQSAFMGFGGVLFITLGGVLVACSWRAPFAIYLFGAPVSVLAIVTLRAVITPPGIREAEVGHDEEAPPRPHPVSDLVIYGLAMLVFVTFYQVPTQLPFLLERLGLRPGGMTGIVMGTMPLLGATVALFYGAGKARLSFPAITSLGLSVMAAGFLIIAVAPSWPVVWVGAAVAGIGWGWIMPNLNVWLLAGVAPARRGRALGRLTSGVFVGQFAAPLIAQPLLGLKGYTAPFWAAAVVLIGVAIALKRAP